ncbi:MAG: NRDE family protein [Alphaproteobacteria bacterium]|nr:NRDE family protein [Alphaproteobacteria bacterium]
MCVLTLAWDIHPDWLLVAAGNRDEAHARPSAPLARWGDGSGVIGGRDLQSGGMWLGVSEPHPRFAVVTNVAGQGAPNPDRLSRGGLVHDALVSRAPLASPELSRFNPFNLIVIAEDAAMERTNRPEPLSRSLAPGWHALSNGLLDAAWDRKERLGDSAVRPRGDPV